MPGRLQLNDAGPAVIVWDAAVGGTPVEFHTDLEDIIFKDEQQMIDIFEGQHGDMPVDKVTSGHLVTFEANVTRCTLADLSRLCIGGTLSGAGNDQILFHNPVGDHMYQYAKEVRIKPVVNGVISTTSQEWVYIFKVIGVRAWEIAHGKAQKVFHVIFHAFPDQTSGNVGNTYKLGDAT